MVPHSSSDVVCTTVLLFQGILEHSNEEKEYYSVAKCQNFGDISSIQVGFLLGSLTFDFTLETFRPTIKFNKVSLLVQLFRFTCFQSFPPSREFDKRIFKNLS